jgi:hypothetical protein
MLGVVNGVRRMLWVLGSCSVCMLEPVHGRCVMYAGGCGERALSAGGAGGDALCAALCTGGCGGGLSLLEVLEVLELSRASPSFWR